jgi:hypothetical protein
MTKTIKTSAIIHEDSNIVVIATGLGTGQKSKNSKTGAMIQTWILAKNLAPMAAIHSGNDSIVCGNCPLRGVTIPKQQAGSPNQTVNKERACYVNVSKAPSNIWKAYKKGHYIYLTGKSLLDAFRDKTVRFGSYGEPVLIPFKIVKSIASVAKGWTGYTHTWNNPLFSAYKSYFMASTNEMDYKQAIAQGWRTFTLTNKVIKNQIVCPASAERGHKTTCEKCLLCSGISRDARSITIASHGVGKKWIDLN